MPSSTRPHQPEPHRPVLLVSTVRTTMPRGIRLTHIVTRADKLVSELEKLRHSAFRPPAAVWCPSVNVYEHPSKFEVCVDLAGVSKDEILIELTDQRLVFRGQRSAPEASCGHPPCGRILIMEISDGSFERTIDFPVDLNVPEAHARQENGWLWISLPKA
ncbi:Hsp20/alpha crystallin family protein [Verrucomicrobium sp. BvORR106]|uniref:Hsp20/alpha crystallin family protein n=1 Tax=Verrucomicrobium sp. BvORR106 TaxID=1403819 RepID=UPI002240FBFF|nr:Hsp20/alpha crystallin family protein [Verrucomicrobium sp. BvORR106]